MPPNDDELRESWDDGDDEIDPLVDEDSDIDSEDDDESSPDVDTDETLQRHHTFVISRDSAMRLDAYLQQRLKGVSRSRVKKLIDAKMVTVNGKQPKPSTPVREKDVIEVELPGLAVKTIEPEPIPIDVLHEDDGFLVINKQAGIIVHPARNHTSGTLINGLAYRFQQQVEAQGKEFKAYQTRGFKKKTRLTKEELGKVQGLSDVGAAEFRPGIIHRLDKYTTGVLVVAKKEAAHWNIAKQFENRKTLKAYLAVVHGNFDHEGDVIEQHIGKHPTIHEAFCVHQNHLSKHAVSIYRVREQYEGYSLVEVELRTGRTHQIRVHLSYIGHPIVGDIIYGGEPIGEAEIINPPIAAGSRKFLNYARAKEEGQNMEAKALAREDLIITHPALHAALLGFTHPDRDEFMRFTAPLHEQMRTLVHKLREHKREDAIVAKKGTWIDLEQAVPF
jgi:23S rRNA pseudouridine1911/1915/1917 synthase